MSKKRKIVMTVLLVASFLLLPIMGHRVGLDSGRADGVATGLVEGQNQGRAELLAEGSQWYCIEAKTGAKAMFCTDDAEAWASMCTQARANGEVNPGLTIVGCPIGTFITASE